MCLKTAALPRLMKKPSAKMAMTKGAKSICVENAIGPFTPWIT